MFKVETKDAIQAPANKESVRGGQDGRLSYEWPYCGTSADWVIIVRSGERMTQTRVGSSKRVGIRKRKKKKSLTTTLQSMMTIKKRRRKRAAGGTDSWLCLCCLPKALNVNTSRSASSPVHSLPLLPPSFFPPRCMTWPAAAARLNCAISYALTLNVPP